MAFVDQYLTRKVGGRGCISTPRFRTSIQVTHGGAERRNQEWEHPLHVFQLPEGVARHPEVIEELRDHWMAMRGPLHSWPWRDPLDHASRPLTKPNVTPVPTMLDQAIGTGDGFTDKYQLVKRYARGGQVYLRTIRLPVAGSVVVAVDGEAVDAADFSVERTSGMVTLADPPPAGQAVTAGFLFDVEVRFESDDMFDGVLRALRVGGFADLTLVEVRGC